MSDDGDKIYNQIFMVAFGVIGLIAMSMLYSKNKEIINSVVVAFHSVHLKVLSWIPGKIGATAAVLQERLIQRNPGNFTFDQLVAQAKYLGEYFRWPVMAIMAGLSLWVWRMGKANKYSNVYSMESLLRHNAKVFPCMAPVALREKSLLKELLDEGPWRTARQPIQWVAENNLLLDENGKPVREDLLINKKNGLVNLKSPLLKSGKNKGLQLDKTKTRQLFVEQLGEPFAGIGSLPDYQKGLAAALIAYGHGNKEDAQELLDQMSLSFREPHEAMEGGWTFMPPFYRKSRKEQTFYIDIEGADELLEKYKNSEDLLYYTKDHSAFVHTWFHAVLEFAREKRVLSTSQFIWLRPTDRTLWYTLNQVGGRTAWTEATGPWAHYQAENILGRTIHDQQVDRGVAALEEMLRDSGWLPILKRKR